MSLLKYESQLREPLVDGNKTYHDITEDICRPIEVNPVNYGMLDSLFLWLYCFLEFIVCIAKLFMVLANGI
jgi:hypothetical protein